MIRLAQDRMKRLLAIHGWSAVGLGLLLYAVIVTGVASVFTDEIADWSAPLAGVPERRMPERLDAPLRETLATVPEEFHDDLVAYPLAGGRVLAYFHKDDTDAEGQPITRGVEVDIDPRSSTVIARREGSDEDIDHQRTSFGLAHFFVDLHVRLHLPNPWGLLLTGVLGLAMLVAAVSGFLIHRHLLRELFTLRWYRERLLRARDAHVVAGTWNLPFAFVLAFTGSFFSFASVVGIPIMAMSAFNGDQEAMMQAVYGTAPSVDATPAALANLDGMIADARQRSGAEPYYFTVEHWGRRDAMVTVTMWPAAHRVLGETYRYQGSSGEFLGEKPSIGLKPSVGGALYGVMAPLHFGNFAGGLSKAIWFALGAASAYVTLTGLALWTERRRAERGWRWLARAVVWVGFGLPMALAAAPYGFFPAFSAGAEVEAPMFTAFFIACAVSLLASLTLRSLETLRRCLLAMIALLLAGLPVLRMLCGGPGWGEALASAQLAVLGMDLGLWVAAALCTWRAWPRRGADLAIDARLLPMERS
jgi:uncharacterized iron-regulated membrane protein